MKLARPDVFHPRIVLAGSAAPSDDDGLVAALSKRGLHARWMPWDDPEISRAHLVILRDTRDYADRREEFLAWTTSVAHLLNAPGVVAWNSDQKSLLDVAGRGVPTVPSEVFAPGQRVQVPKGAAVGGRQFVDPATATAHAEKMQQQGRSVLVQQYDPDATKTVLVFIGGKPSHAFVGTEPVEPDFEVWDVGFAALDAAAAETGIAAGELLYARVTTVGGFDDPRLLALDLVSPSLGWRVLDDDTRDLQQRQFALAVESALERLGLGPLSHRRP